MRVYLDDNMADPVLVVLLRNAGHTVTIPADVGQSGRSDAKHLEYALRTGFVLLTQDRKDFTDLHDLVLAAGGNHAGILLVRSDNDRKRDMKPRVIVRAIAKLEAAGLALRNTIHVLNHWR